METFLRSLKRPPEGALSPRGPVSAAQRAPKRPYQFSVPYISPTPRTKGLPCGSSNLPAYSAPQPPTKELQFPASSPLAGFPPLSASEARVRVRATASQFLDCQEPTSAVSSQWPWGPAGPTPSPFGRLTEMFALPGETAYDPIRTHPRQLFLPAQSPQPQAARPGLPHAWTPTPAGGSKPPPGTRAPRFLAPPRPPLRLGLWKTRMALATPPLH